MVFKKRLDYGFNAFNVRNVPRAPRSIRRWGRSKKTVEESRFCAFELLASLAGKLLQESESSASSNASEGHDHVSVGKNVIKQEIQYEDKLLKTECFEQGGCEVSGVASESTIENSDNLKEFTCAENDAILELTSTKTDPACSGQISGDLKPVICTGNVTYGNFAGNLDRCSPYFGELCDGKTENGFKQQRDPQGSETVASGGGIKPLYCKRKTYYNYDSCQYDTLYKRRKIVDCNSMVTSDGEISGESVTNSPEKVMNEDKISTAAMSNGACRISSVFTGHQASPRHKDSHMKFSIKSFRIPELYIEVPETATIGSLKRTVMEAVTAFLGGGIRVGVLLQGKNVRDDSRTLSQTGISCEDNLDALGFTLEPSPAKAPPSVCLEEPPVLLSCDAAPQNLTSSPDTPAVDTVITDAAPDPPLLTNSEDHVANHEPVSSQTDMLTDQSLSESRALVPVPAMNVEALAAVPANQKIQKSELAQRRTRRPFSVSEVEALVQAVEELGTGRWRDVKLRAFENADYRTYVDLKDKWKTLVHTAEISPQHRRGELVPQQLLDRVLAAHGYWSQHQAKKQGKHHTETLRITDTQADRNGVEAVPTGRM